MDIAKLSAAERQALRNKHTCIKACSSMRCHACNNGTPYPALTLDEIDELLIRGGQEAEAAVPALFARPGKRR